MMNRNIKFIGIALLFCAFSAQAQTGVGVRTPDDSSILEVSSFTKKGGVLLPKVNLINALDITTIPNPAVGLMVYNTSTAGTKPNDVETDHHYFWNGSRWIDLADINTLRKLLLPQVFFSQETSVQGLSSSDLSALNTSGVTVLFDPSTVLTNNGNNITLNNNIFIVNTTGVYEISGFVNYNPRVSSSNNTNLIYKIQQSTNGGATWNTVTQTTLVWGKGTGGYSRTLIIPPSNITLSKNDLLRAVINKSYGSNHGSGAEIRVPGGLSFSRNIRILKLD